MTERERYEAIPHGIFTYTGTADSVHYSPNRLIFETNNHLDLQGNIRSRLGRMYADGFRELEVGGLLELFKQQFPIVFTLMGIE